MKIRKPGEPAIHAELRDYLPPWHFLPLPLPCLVAFESYVVTNCMTGESEMSHGESWLLQSSAAEYELLLADDDERRRLEAAGYRFLCVD